jgi:hypothetical protein
MKGGRRLPIVESVRNRTKLAGGQSTSISASVSAPRTVLGMIASFGWGKRAFRVAPQMQWVFADNYRILPRFVDECG